MQIVVFDSGLSIVQKILSCMNSKVFVTSEYGLGSTFSFNLTLQKVIADAQLLPNEVEVVNEAKYNNHVSHNNDDNDDGDGESPPKLDIESLQARRSTSGFQDSAPFASASESPENNIPFVSSSSTSLFDTASFHLPLNSNVTVPCPPMPSISPPSSLSSGSITPDETASNIFVDPLAYILIVDDSTINLKILQRMLKGNINYMIKTASNGLEGLNVVKNDMYDDDEINQTISTKPKLRCVCVLMDLMVAVHSFIHSFIHSVSFVESYSYHFYRMSI